MTHESSPYDKPGPYRARYLTTKQASFFWGGDGVPGAETYLRHHNKLFLRGKLDPTKYPRQRVEALKALYDGGLYYLDEHFGVLMKILDDEGLSSNTVVILTADHGEAFLEHTFFHHIEVYNQAHRKAALQENLLNWVAARRTTGHRICRCSPNPPGVNEPRGPLMLRIINWCNPVFSGP